MSSPSSLVGWRSAGVISCGRSGTKWRRAEEPNPLDPTRKAPWLTGVGNWATGRRWIHLELLGPAATVNIGVAPSIARSGEEDGVWPSQGGSRGGLGRDQAAGEGVGTWPAASQEGADAGWEVGDGGSQIRRQEPPRDDVVGGRRDGAAAARGK